MPLWRPDSRTTAPAAPCAEPATALAARLAEALQTGGPELPDDQAASAYEIVNKTRERMAIVGKHTVVALAGATGSGKSSLFNDLVGEAVSTVGVRRPTTSRASAAVWGDDPADSLLTWLGVGARHLVAGPPADPGDDGLADGGPLDGLVLLDLPDFDSRSAANRAEADRVLKLADVFVWVTDPQKYADRRLHEDYIRALADHRAVTLCVLNHADTLSPQQLSTCLTDLERLLEADGLGQVEVIATSARTGDGVVELENELAVAVAENKAVEERLRADLRSSATALRKYVGNSEPEVSAEPDSELVSALARAAGVPVVLEAVERDYQRESRAMTGWPFTRWARQLSPDPLKRLRLKDAVQWGVDEVSVRRTIGRSSLPPPTPAARAAVDVSSRRLTDAAADGLPARWAEAVHLAATPPGADLVDALDTTVMGVPLRARKPKTWAVVNIVQWILAAIALAGLVWLLALMALGWMQLPVPDVPRWGIFPIPLLMLAGGIVLGLLLAWTSAWFAKAGAGRRREGIGRRFNTAIAEVAATRLLEPVRDVLERHRRTRETLDSVISSR